MPTKTLLKKPYLLYCNLILAQVAIQCSSCFFVYNYIKKISPQVGGQMLVGKEAVFAVSIHWCVLHHENQITKFGD